MDALGRECQPEAIGRRAMTDRELAGRYAKVATLGVNVLIDWAADDEAPNEDDRRLALPGFNEALREIERVAEDIKIAARHRRCGHPPMSCVIGDDCIKLLAFAALAVIQLGAFEDEAPPARSMN